MSEDSPSKAKQLAYYKKQYKQAVSDIKDFEDPSDHIGETVRDVLPYDEDEYKTEVIDNLREHMIADLRSEFKIKGQIKKKSKKKRKYSYNK